MDRLEWQKRTISFDYLQKAAAKEGGTLSMVSWLRLIGVIPITTEWKRGNRHPNTNLNPSAIPAGYLAEVAHDWDMEGRTTAAEFVGALAFEIKDTAENNAVKTALGELTEDAQKWSDSSRAS